MKLFSVTTLVSVIVAAYICHTVYIIYGIWNPPSCPSAGKAQCFLPYKPPTGTSWNLNVYCTKKKKLDSISTLKPIWSVKDIDFQKQYDETVEVELPKTKKLSTNLYIHVVLHEQGRLQSGDYSNTKLFQLTKYSKAVKFFKLVSDGNDTESSPKSEMVLHWRSKMNVNVVHPPFRFIKNDFPMDIAMHIKQTKYGSYLPILFIDELSLLKSDLKEIKSDMTNVSLDISYSAISIEKLRLWTTLLNSLTAMQDLGFTEEDTEEIRGIFTDTNIYFLAATFFVSTFHILFDFLAFKHDIDFWRKRDSMTGLSFNTVVYRCVSTIIIFLYLMNEKTSYLVLIPAGIGSVIELWKVTRALKIKVTRNGWRFQIHVGDHSRDEQTTENYDHQAIQYLSYVLYPLVALGAIYSLFYVPHKSWYSWLINSLANGVYAFGFLFMLPQLFINYKMKSVAHLPWKAFTYKAFNTFIDDVFAFIIKMPTSHRIACFRDDIVFFCYLYQRWLYPVDKSRVNEFGISYEDEDKKKK